MIENKIAKSGLITLDAEEMLQSEILSSIDIKPFLWQDLVVKEKEFRQHIADIDWNQFEGHQVAIYCSVDAIVPHWAFMLVATALSEAKHFYFSDPGKLPEMVVLNLIDKLNINEFENQRVIIKGCGKLDLTPAVYVHFTQKLKPVVKSLMFGEPCSTVPVFKRK